MPLGVVASQCENRGAIAAAEHQGPRSSAGGGGGGGTAQGAISVSSKNIHEALDSIGDLSQARGCEIEEPRARFVEPFSPHAPIASPLGRDDG